MENIIQSIIECDSLYGMICYICSLFFIYILVRFSLPWINKYLGKICNLISKYKDINIKACVDDVSIETELHK
jgi:hypothetical protein